MNIDTLVYLVTKETVRQYQRIVYRLEGIVVQKRAVNTFWYT